ncbi:fimbrial protein [Pseudenterobacter timonensis]|uniref:Fimbrial protein n=1 Tax=Pseudenterobacter timonensis TaxID=1755099 RepID=A0AAE4DKX5_9ENTR|nr:fimbrial protein [Pseudenterobacter timonensis]MDR9889402.1 fimbrial protein [Pseudenterobacter timonensis]
MKLKGYLTHAIWAKILATVLLLVQNYAWGDECHFGWKGEGGTSTIINTQVSSPVYFHEVPQGQYPGGGIIIGGPYEASLSPALWSKCDAGDDGDQMSNIVYGASGRGADGKTLWPTNLPGIYYAVRVYSPINSGSWFQNLQNGVWENIPVHVNHTEDHNWKIQISLVQMSTFLGNPNNITVITPKEASKIGGMAIGNHTDSDNLPWWFNVTTNSFRIPVAASTCQTAMVNNGTNNVDFGEVMFSTVRTGWYPHQAFNLQLRGCNNVVAIQYKVSSTKTDGTSKSGTLMLNTLTSNAAAGVGVSINQTFSADPSGHGEPFINDPNYIYVPLPNAGAGASNDLPFEAYFERDQSQELKAGNFKALATFTINYL